ncbi:Demethylsterigmatocystin 6-O-methyltransferase [Cyphellophora attinorum]|uniref:Demethylsterigmatocystin 6-O-methyltransferase n=1 Tax=Cyphellophora attinorum TaxID=1664694 RepID=A0A0N1HZM5_9EURO|nr:Demethylsterigmatocystin 6-O-methyltransferase [Phialophora attinorum]KPI44303.1 Demethylsterigmatocystin 6-O-methyltransferase [Phialophora attinorum]
MASYGAAVATLSSLVELQNDLSNEDTHARLRALELCSKLQAELELPGEKLMRTQWAEPLHISALNAAHDLHIYSILAENDNAPKSVSQITETTKAEPFLIRRILRQLAAFRSITETSVDTFANNKFSQFLLEDSAASTLKFTRWFAPVIAQAPDFLAHYEWKSPADPQKAAFAWTLGLGDLNWFEHLSQDPVNGALFGRMMRAQSEGKPTWSDGLYPVKQLHSDGNALIVDIGGGNGHDLESAYVIDHVNLDGIDKMAYDYYTEQPVKGAQVYFMHQIMHDHDNAQCLKILRAVVPAMKPGYSKLLINDLVLPDQDAHWYPSTMDLLMMLTMCGRERTTQQWFDLINEVGGGLRIEKIWTPTATTGMADSLIECVVD